MVLQFFVMVMATYYLNIQIMLGSPSMTLEGLGLILPVSLACFIPPL